jgi:hypothetical protein
LKTERVAIVGSRFGYDQAHLVFFVNDLYRKHPDTVLVSGGARGADTQAESIWKMHGGEVLSYRPHKHKRGEGWGFARHRFPRNDDIGFPELDIWPGFSVKTQVQALWLRSAYIACDVADRLVAFFRPGGSNGTQLTVELARGRGIPVYTYYAEGEVFVPEWQRRRVAQTDL